MEKKAGIAGEVAGTMINPIGLVSSPLAGLVGYGYGDKDSNENIADGPMSILSNLLVPGLAPYRLGKRLRAGSEQGRETRALIRENLKKNLEDK